MKENVVTAGAVISVPARTGSGEWPVLHPRKTSRESKDPVVIAYSFFCPFHDSGLLTTSTLLKGTVLPLAIIYAVKILVLSTT